MLRQIRIVHAKKKSWVQPEQGWAIFHRTPFFMLIKDSLEKLRSQEPFHGVEKYHVNSIVVTERSILCLEGQLLPVSGKHFEAIKFHFCIIFLPELSYNWKSSTRWMRKLVVDRFTPVVVLRRHDDDDKVCCFFRVAKKTVCRWIAVEISFFNFLCEESSSSKWKCWKFSMKWIHAHNWDSQSKLTFHVVLFRERWNFFFWVR